MQTLSTLAVLFVTLASPILVAVAGRAAENPLGKVMDLLTDLHAKITNDGEAEETAYKQFLDWCDGSSQNAKFEIKTGTMQKGKLDAKISKLSSAIEASDSKIEDLAVAIATSTKELQDATVIRRKEARDFIASEKELMEVLDSLTRATAVLEREMQKSPSSFTQLNAASTRSVLQSLGMIVDAAGLSAIDRQRLLALAQAQEANDEQGEDMGAPAAAAYKTHSSDILDVLEDLREKAEAQLSDLRKAESNSKHNHDMLEQSLQAQLAADNKDLSEEKAAKAEAEESRAAAEGEQDGAVKRLSSAEAALGTSHRNCMQMATDHEATIKAREEELKVIAQAIEALKSTSPGAVEQTYSFLQLRTREDLAGSEVVALLKRLAHEHRSMALAQLASRVAAVMRYGTDPFAKVKGLIQNLIEQLEAEAQSEATEKAYCDEEIAKTEMKKGELGDDISKLTVKIDQAAAKSAELKEEVKDLQTELSALMKQQAELDKIRMDSHAAYVKAKADLELGLSGIRRALSLLRQYYVAESGAASMLQDGTSLNAAMQQPFAKATGAGTSIIGVLEVIESDFATHLAKEETEEGDAESEYQKVTKENQVSKTLKEKDVEYNSQEIKQLSKSLTDFFADRESTDAELAAVLEYYGKLKERCIAKPTSYEKRKERRTAEIEGLKSALSILENEGSLLQRKRRNHFRGTLAPH